MKPISYALYNALLQHHLHVCRQHLLRPPILDRCTIRYAALIDLAGLDLPPIATGPFLAEIADWCSKNKWPPLNSLVVNDTGMPGDNYDLAVGCSLLDWPRQATECVAFEAYPPPTT